MRWHILIICCSIFLTGCTLTKEAPEGTLQLSINDTHARMESQLTDIYKKVPVKEEDKNTYTITATLWIAPPGKAPLIDLTLSGISELDYPQVSTYIIAKENAINEQSWPKDAAWTRFVKKYHQEGFNSATSYRNGNFAPKGQTTGSCSLSYITHQGDTTRRFDLCREAVDSVDDINVVALRLGPGSKRETLATR